MTLAEFVLLNANAAIHLFQTGRMGLLTDDPRILAGECDVMEATVLLLERQLKRTNFSELTKPEQRRRELRDGTRAKRQPTSAYRGVALNRGRWVARVAIGSKERRHIGIFGTPREAALAYDAYVAEHYPGKDTNASLGLL